VKVAPLTAELKTKVASAFMVGFAGPDVMLAVGIAVSMVHFHLLGGPTLPARSVAQTVRVWLPSGSFW
jgi:hypothetical protein